MNLRLDTDADQFAILQACNLTETRSVSTLLAHAANDHCPAEVDFVCTIRKALIPNSYRSNPTVFAAKIRAATHPLSFRNHAGTDLGTHIRVFLFRGEKSATRPLTFHATILAWLQSDTKEPLIVSVTDIPPSAIARSEQVTYKIKLETGKRITIKKLKTQWKIYQ